MKIPKSANRAPSGKRRNIGRGYWLKVARIPNNRVAKFFSEPVSKEEARRISKAHEIFIRLLREAGVNVPETGMEKKIMRNGQVRLRIIQQGFPPESLGEQVLRNSGAREAIAFGRRLVDETIKVHRFNREVAGPRYGVIVGADFKPDNIALEDGRIVFIDTFSPHIRPLKEPDRINPAFARYFAKRGWALEKLTKGYISQTVYDPKKRMASLMAELSRVRPDLARPFIQAARERIEEEKDPVVRAELLAAVQRWPVLKARGMGRLISYLGKRKGMTIKLG